MKNNYVCANCVQSILHEYFVCKYLKESTLLTVFFFNRRIFFYFISYDIQYGYVEYLLWSEYKAWSILVDNFQKLIKPYYMKVSKSLVFGSRDLIFPIPFTRNIRYCHWVYTTSISREWHFTTRSRSFTYCFVHEE